MGTTHALCRPPGGRGGRQKKKLANLPGSPKRRTDTNLSSAEPLSEVLAASE
jgi:hypothetical protein